MKKKSSPDRTSLSVQHPSNFLKNKNPTDDSLRAARAGAETLLKHSRFHSTCLLCTPLRELHRRTKALLYWGCYRRVQPSPRLWFWLLLGFETGGLSQIRNERTCVSYCASTKVLQAATFMHSHEFVGVGCTAPESPPFQIASLDS